MNTSTNLEIGALPKLVALTKARRLNKGKGFSYDYVKRVLNPNDKRTNASILALAHELVQANNKAAKELNPTAPPAPLPRMLNAPTTSNLTKDPRWVHGDRMRLMILAKERGIGGGYIDQAIHGFRVNSKASKKHFQAFREMAEEYLAARASGKPLLILGPTEELHALREENAKLKEDAMYFQKAGNLMRDNVDAAERITQNLEEREARATALEENAQYMEAQLRKREEQLVELGKELEQANAERDELLQLMGRELGVADGEVLPLADLQELAAQAKNRRELRAEVVEWHELYNTTKKECDKLINEVEQRQDQITRLRQDLQAANDRAYRLEELLDVIRKTAKLAKA